MHFQLDTRVIVPALAALSSVLLLAACGSNEGGEASTAIETDYSEARTIHQLMTEVVQSNADVYWSAVQIVSDETGQHEIEPETEEEWEVTRVAAANLSTYGTLLMSPLYAAGRGQDWMDFAQGLSMMGNRAEQAAIDHDPDAVFEAGGNLYNVCQGCHQVYPPEQPTTEPLRDPTAEVQAPSAELSLEEFLEQADETANAN